MNKKSICAVVVTYNRKELLLECLSALKQQTYPVDHIVVINNASTDGTIDFLREHNWNDDNSFQLITLNENMGGAGGFHQGIKYAYEKGFDYIWLMDDDGYPNKSCLEKLSAYATENCYIGPLVLDIKNKNSFCFPMRIPNSLMILNTINDLSHLENRDKIDNIVIPFNGILLSSKLVKNNGLPQKEYFIWGDDFEYTWRMKMNGAFIASIIEAEFYHPKEISLGTPMFFNKFHFNDSNSLLKIYCMCRNTISNHSKYNTNFHILGFIAKVMHFYLFTNPNWNKLKVAIRGIYHGLRKDFTHHKDYL